MSDVEDHKPDELSFLATYKGSRENVSAGGVVYSFVVPFADASAADDVLGGRFQPDNIIEVAIAPVNRVKIVANS